MVCMVPANLSAFMANILDATLNDGTLELVIKSQRLDAVTAPDLKKECAVLWQPAIQRVIADLEAVDFLDSSGVGALLSIYKRLRPESASLQLVRVQPAVQSVIELLRLHRIFDVQPKSFVV